MYVDVCAVRRGGVGGHVGKEGVSATKWVKVVRDTGMDKNYLQHNQLDTIHLFSINSN